MQHYRLTIRIGRPGRSYDVHDIEAASLRDALQRALDVFPLDADGADLLELRVQADPDQRNYAPG